MSSNAPTTAITITAVALSMVLEVESEHKRFLLGFVDTACASEQNEEKAVRLS